jgi:CHAT domain-containing protein/tetratricopeptide (TPR) repeat protein
VRREADELVRRLAAAVLAAAVVAGISSWSCQRAPPVAGARPDLAELAVAVSNDGARPLLGRLAGLPAHAPYQRRRGDAPGPSPALRIAAARLESKASDAAEGAPARGLAELVCGRLDSAIASLRYAARRNPASAALLNDLSVAYLERGHRLGRFGDYAWALAFAERALTRTPGMPEATFNRAMALTALHLTDEARQALQACQMADPGPWGVEAASQLRPAPFTGNPHRPPSRQRIREQIEDELLPNWASAFLGGDDARASDLLRQASTAAAALAEAGGDDMPRAGIEAIAGAAAGRRTARVAALARAHLDFAEARRHLLALRLSDAASAAERAARGFAEGDSPYRLWAAVYRAISDRIAGRSARALAALRTHDARLPAGRYGHWRARVLWTRAVSNATLGRLDVARSEFEQARRAFDDLGEPGNASAMRTMLAEVLADLGDYAGAWEEQGRALELLGGDLGSTRPDMIYLTGAYLADREGLSETALRFRDALVAEDLRRGDAPRLAEAYLHRAASLAVLGRRAEADEDFRRAQETTDGLSDPGLRDRLEAERRAARARTSVGDPHVALADAGAALRYFESSGDRIAAVLAYLSRARAHLALGRVAEAEHDLGAATRQYERHQAQLVTTEERSLSFEDGREAYFEMIRLQAVLKGDPGQAFRYSERSRGPSAGASRLPGPLSASAILPPATAVVYFVTLEDRVLSWIVTRTGGSYLERKIGRAQLEGAAEDLVVALTRGGTAELARFSKALWRDLFGGFDDTLRAATRLVIIPDGPLYTVPFPALIQPSGRYLIEDWAVTVAPSMALATRALRPSRASSVLAVGDGHTPTSTLPRLRMADAEADAIGTIYPRSVVLRGADATVARFLELAPSFDAIHFAGHSIANADRPQFSRLLLAPQGTDDEGAVFTRDIEALRLAGTRVAVLASCSTAAGRAARGQGPLSLARPFLDAGVGHVVASLWPVDDEQSIRLATRIHGELQHRSGCAEAVQAAQVEALRSKDPHRSAPVAWSGLVTYGGGVDAPLHTKGRVR